MNDGTGSAIVLTYFQVFGVIPAALYFHHNKLTGSDNNHNLGTLFNQTDIFEQN